MSSTAELQRYLPSNSKLSEELEFHDLRFEGVRVQKDDFAGISKAGHCDEPDFLTSRSFDG